MHPPPEPSDPRRRRFEAIYAANHGRILGYLLRRAASTDDAADALAETFLVAWRRIDDVPAGDEARLWLYGVARRVLADQRRGERRRDALHADLAVQVRADLRVHAPDPHQRAGELSAAGAAFRRLAPADRELLSLAGWEELAAGEIATVLGCSVNAARIRLFRARRRFAQQLEQAGEPATYPLPVTAPNGEHA